MQLAGFPRRRYTHGATPLEWLPRLSRYLGGPDIWIKRDDFTGLAGDGSKALLQSWSAPGCALN